MNQLRSSRRLEAECQRNVEVMWLLGRLRPDYKTIAEFRRLHREAVKEAGAELVRLAREVGLVRGEWVAIDGSKFRAVSSAARVKEREAVQRYLDEMERADEQDEVVIDPAPWRRRWKSCTTIQNRKRSSCGRRRGSVRRTTCRRRWMRSAASSWRKR